MTAEMREQDPRLSRAITVVRTRVYLGDLVEQLTAETGVRIETGGKDSFSEVLLCIRCKDVKLGDLLDGIWSLLSYKGDMWRWERTGERGVYAYTIRQSSSAPRFKERMRSWEQNAFESILKRLLAAVDEDAEGRARAIRETIDVKEIPYPSESTLFPMDIFWSQLRIIRDAFTPDQLVEFVRGRGPTEGAIVPVEKLSDSSRAFLEREREFQRVHTTSMAPLPEQSTIRVVLASRSKCPLITVVYQGARTAPRYVGGAILGVFLKKQMLALWTHEGDSLADSRDRRIIDPKAPEERLPERFEMGDSRRSPWWRLASTLFEVSDGAYVNLLARLPDNEPSWLINSPRGKTVAEYWKEMYGRPLMQKWRNGIHLVSAANWPLQDGPVPLEFVRKLRKHAGPGEFLPFEDLAEAAVALTDDQVLDLQWEFPAMAMVIERRDMLGALRVYPELMRQARSDQGLALTDQVMEQFRRLPAQRFVTRLRAAEDLTLKVHVTEPTPPDSGNRALVFEYYNKKGRLAGFLDFSEMRQPKPPDPPSAAGR